MKEGVKVGQMDNLHVKFALKGKWVEVIRVMEETRYSVQSSCKI